jgi:hypothetical protein
MLDDVDGGFEGRVGEHEPPSRVADALHEAGHVAFAVVAIFERTTLVAELERSEEHHPRLSRRGKQMADRPLRTGELGKAQHALFRANAAVEGWVGHIVQQAGLLAAHLDHPAIIFAGRRSDPPDSNVRPKERPLAFQRKPLAGGFDLADRLHPGGAPFAQPLPIMFGGDRAPIGRGGRGDRDRFLTAGRTGRKQDERAKRRCDKLHGLRP